MRSDGDITVEWFQRKGVQNRDEIEFITLFTIVFTIIGKNKTCIIPGEIFSRDDIGFFFFRFKTYNDIYVYS